MIIMNIKKKNIDNGEIYSIALMLYEQNNNKPISINAIPTYLHVASKWFQKRNRKLEDYANFPDVTENIIRTFTIFDFPLSTKGAYWLGYIMADGCIAPQNYKKPDGTQRLIFDVKTDDIEILYNFCQDLGIRKNRIYFGHKGNSVGLTIQENNFITFVSEYGIDRNKSSKENSIDDRILEKDELFLAFFHGYFDGDGTVHPYKHSPGISVVGDKKFELQLKEKFEGILPCPSSIFIDMAYYYQHPEKAKVQINSDRPLYQFKIGSGFHNRENLRYLYNQFYNQTQYSYLNRKRLVFEQALGTL